MYRLKDRTVLKRCLHPTAHLGAANACLNRLRMSAVAEQSQVRVLETAPPSSTSSSDKLLSRIAILLFLLVAGLLTVFGYYASSICITVVLAGFLATLFDPVVVVLEELHLPRGVAAAGIVLAGISLIALLGYVLYGRTMSFAGELPVHASKVQQTIESISRKIQDFQQSAGDSRTTCIPARKSPRFGCRNRQLLNERDFFGEGCLTGQPLRCLARPQ
jgi:hypothetical protein